MKNLSFRRWLFLTGLLLPCLLADARPHSEAELASIDVGVSAPRLVGSSCAKAVQIDVTNFSASTIFPAGSHIPVYYSFTTGTTIDTLVLSQDLAPNEGVTFTFTQLPVVTSNLWITVGVRYPQDMNQANDNQYSYVIADNELTIGGVNPDFTSLQGALMIVAGGFVRYCDAPVVFKIRPGTYDGPLIIGNYPALTEAFPLVLESETGNSSDVVVTNSSTMATVLMNGARHVVLKNLTLQSGQSESTIALAGNCNHITITGNTILGRGIKGNGPGDSLTPNEYIAITGNTFLDFFGMAIELFHIQNFTISDNTIISSQRAGAIQTLLSSGVGTIERNKILLENAFRGVYIGVHSGPGALSLINNFVDLKCGSSELQGMFILSVDDARVLHNTIRIMDGSQHPSEGSRAFLTNVINQSLEVKNNIFYNTINDGTGMHIVSDQASTVTVDFNDYFVPNGFTGVMQIQAPQTYETLAEWQQGTGLDPHSINNEPVFQSETDLHLAPLQSPFLRMAINTSVTDDVDGELRSISPFIGADEDPTTSFTLTGVASGSQVTLNWNEPPTDPLVYTVFASVQGGPQQLIGTVIAPLTTFTHTGLEIGFSYTYQVYAVSPNEVVISNTITETILGIEPEITVFPNPVENGTLILHGDIESDGPYEVTIHNTYGRTWQYKPLYLQRGETTPEIDVSGLPPGIYVLSLTGKKGVSKTFRFEKK